MSEQGNVKVARAFLQTFNAADWDSVKGSLAPNSVYDELGTERRIEGSDAIVSLYQAWKTAMPDVQGNIKNVLTSDASVALEVVWEGTQTGPLETPGGTLPLRQEAGRARRLRT